MFTLPSPLRCTFAATLMLASFFTASHATPPEVFSNSPDSTRKRTYTTTEAGPFSPVRSLQLFNNSSPEDCAASPSSHGSLPEGPKAAKRTRSQMGRKGEGKENRPNPGPLWGDAFSDAASAAPASQGPSILEKIEAALLRKNPDFEKACKAMRSAIESVDKAKGFSDEYSIIQDAYSPIEAYLELLQKKQAALPHHRDSSDFFPEGLPEVMEQISSLTSLLSAALRPHSASALVADRFLARYPNFKATLRQATELSEEVERSVNPSYQLSTALLRACTTAKEVLIVAQEDMDPESYEEISKQLEGSLDLARRSLPDPKTP